MTFDWGAFAALVAFAAFIFALIGRLMKRFNDLDEKYSKLFAELDKRFDEHAETDLRDHAVVKAQMSDIALTASETYMRRREMEIVTRDFNAMLVEIRKEIGGVNSRIDAFSARIDLLVRDGAMHRGRDG